MPAMSWPAPSAAILTIMAAWSWWAGIALASMLAAARASLQCAIEADAKLSTGSDTASIQINKVRSIFTR